MKWHALARFGAVLTWLVFSANARGEVDFQPATLRGKVPAQAIAYLRLPSPWGFLSTPKGNALAPALRHDATRAVLTQLDGALFEKVLSRMDAPVKPVLSVLLHHLRSPLEAIVLPPAAGPGLMPTIFLSATLDLASLDAFNALLAELALADPDTQIMSPTTAGGPGIVAVKGLPLMVHYEAANKTLSIMAGTAPDPAHFKALLDLAPLDGHPMHAMEAQIDSSGHGLFLWVNAQNLLPFVESFIPATDLVRMEKWGLLATRSAALGWGASGGKGRLKLLADIPKAGYLRLIPRIANDISLRSSGEPGLVLAASILQPELLQAALDLLALEGGESAVAELEKALRELNQKMGVSLDSILASVGPELVMFTDTHGEYLALKVRDAERLTTLLARLVTHFKLTHRTRVIGERTYHHLRVPLPSTLDADGGLAAARLPTLAAGSSLHLYWVDDGDYLIFAQVPQALLDRTRATHPVAVGDWLANKQGQSLTNSVFALSTTIDDTPRFFYYAYLQILQAMGDLTGSEVDLFALPSATELGMPRDGSYGVQLDFADPLISLTFTFEVTPLDFVVAMNSSGLGAVGVLAAVAVPAYADYTARARLAGLHLEIRQRLTEHVTTTNTLPGPGLALNLSEQSRALVESIDIGAGGVVTLTLASPATVRGNTVLYEPIIADQQLQGWQCTKGTLPGKFRAVNCR